MRISVKAPDLKTKYAHLAANVWPACESRTRCVSAPLFIVERLEQMKVCDNVYHIS